VNDSSCPSCQQPLPVDVVLAGKPVPCPHCGVMPGVAIPADGILDVEPADVPTDFATAAPFTPLSASAREPQPLGCVLSVLGMIGIAYGALGCCVGSATFARSSSDAYNRGADIGMLFQIGVALVGTVMVVAGLYLRTRR